MSGSHERLPSPKLNHSRPMLLLLIMMLPTSPTSISPVQHQSNVSAYRMSYLFSTLALCLFCGFICSLKTRLQKIAIVSAFTFGKLHVNTGMQLLWLSICLAWLPSLFHYLDVVESEQLLSSNEFSWCLVIILVLWTWDMRTLW